VFRFSILRKILFFSLTFALASIAILWALQGFFNGGFWYFTAFVLGLILMSTFAFYLLFIRPLGVVLSQVRLLLSGREFKKILTNRTDEVGFLAYFFNEVTKNFEEVSKRLASQEKLESEMQLASSIQREILPQQVPQFPGFEIVAKTRFADDLGGDCYGFVSKGDRHLTYVGDVTGHGLPAALVMMMVSTLLDVYAGVHAQAKDIVAAANRQLKPRIKATMFMTMVLLAWDSAQRKLSFVGAGHEYLFVYRKHTGVVERIPAGGIALGMVPEISALIAEKEISLEVGDSVLIFSDGIVEARNQKEEMFGFDRLAESFGAHAATYSAEGVVFHISRDFGLFCGDHEQDDDITLICMLYKG
jgi:sigma-B regulation protein RsbU (phosphoserine phosphatase)